ncbi:MAG: hypothetical protein ACOCSK_00590, partial [Rhodothermales bacterium]
DVGDALVRKAQEHGYLSLFATTAADVRTSQGLVQRKSALFGRLLARRILRLPIPHYRGFHLWPAWWAASFDVKARSVGGTFRRALRRNWWRRTPVELP